MGQRFSLRQLHHEVTLALVLLETMEGRDVLVAEGGQQLGLSLEASKPLLILRHALRQHLDRHISIEALVTCSINHTHPTLAELGGDAVVAEGGADHLQSSDRFMRRSIAR